MPLEGSTLAFGQFIGATISSPTPAITPIQIENSMSETMTALTSSANEYTFGQPITFTATVDATSQGIKKSSGTISFMDGITFIGSGDIISGQAILTTSALSVGSHSITAQYNSNNNFKSSTSSVLTLQVNQPSTELHPNPQYYKSASSISKCRNS